MGDTPCGSPRGSALAPRQDRSFHLAALNALLLLHRHSEQDTAPGRLHLALSHSLYERSHRPHESFRLCLMDPVTRLDDDQLAVGEDASRLCQLVIL